MTENSNRSEPGALPGLPSATQGERIEQQLLRGSEGDLEHEGDARCRRKRRGRLDVDDHPVVEHHSTLTIDAAQKLGPVRGTILRPFLKKMFYGINFTPFIEEAERREKAATA
jgi:hypothetical protein